MLWYTTLESDPDLASDRAKRDVELQPEMKRVWDDNQPVYGARKLWNAMRLENYDLARCTIERLMHDIGIEGVRRRKRIKTPWPNKVLPCPLDLSRFSAAPRARLSHLSFESDRAFPAQC